MSKEVYYLPDDQFPTKEADRNTNLWTKDVFQKVIVGDSNTGQGGMSYEEVIALGGLPYEASVFAYGGGFFEEKNILRLVVKKSPTGESTHYFFHSQDDKVEVSC